MKKIKILSLLIMVSLVISCSTVGTEKRAQSAEGHYKLGVAYLTEDKVQEAFIEFQKAYEITPNDKEVLNGLGIIYLLHYDEPRKAVDFFQRAVKVDPGYSEGYNNLGVAHMRLGDFETAISFYKKALSNLTYPTAEKAYLNMGEAYYRLGKYEAAVSAIKEALKRVPGLGLAYMRLALCYNAMGKYGDASSAMTEWMNLEPTYRGNRDKAIEDLTQRKLRASGFEEQDIRDYIEILKY